MGDDARPGRSRADRGRRSRPLPGRVTRGLLCWAALGWAVLCLAGALLIVVPDPNPTLYIVGVLFTEFSLVLTMAAGLGLGFAALAASAGARVIAGLTAIACLAAMGVSLIPIRDGLRTAAEQGLTLSPARYLPRPPTAAPRHPVTYIGADGAGVHRRLDVWQVDASSGPPGGRSPAVVLVHGGGWDRGSRGGSVLAGWLADRGYVVFDIDYRLATPRRPSWQHATGDVKCAVGWVDAHATRLGVDPERIGLLGSSAGGHLALLAAYSNSEPRLPAGCHPDGEVRAVAALYPVTDLTAFYGTPTRWLDWSRDIRGQATRLVGGTPATVPNRYRIASPLTHVDDGVPPTYLAHGTRDQVVPISQSLHLARRLRQVDVPHRMVALHGSNHGYDLFGGGWNTQTTLSTLEDFLGTWLAPAPR
jgi:acetyl esterase